ncbi:MAG: multicopper oxidase domain-containing protein [Chloroflexi bacterium]|nr:multicopper oxidase domain-containing protein [Chloroflexota bacterium]
MFRTTSRLLVLALVLTFTLVACGGAAASSTTSTEPKTVTLTLSEFQFQPAEITTKVGQPINLVLKNNGTVLHDFVSTDAMVEVMEEHGAMHDMAGMQTNMHAAIEAGQESTLEFKATQTGTYTFYCTIAGHREAGMTGKLIVK